MTNFIVTPNGELDEIFKLPKKHDMLQHIIYVFAWHPLPLPTQQTWQHSHKIQASVSLEILNYKLI
jgi:hypothetical protein